jgi:hypothetical protein
MTMRRFAMCLAALLLGTAESARAEEAAGGSGQALQEAAQNPIANLISVPFQNNFNFGAGENEKMIYVLNVQPVYPATLTESWNLIVRPIVPIINQPQLFDLPGWHSAFGLGDINLQLYLTPSRALETGIGNVSWGIGPTLVFPTATDELLGTEKWSAGPGAVVFISKAPFTYGALVNNLWSYAGDDDREDVNQFLLQPFINYNLSDGWSLGAAPIITANWKAEEGETWTVPVGGGVGKLFRVGKLPIQANLRAYYNAIRPEFGPEWQLQLQFSLLFPK